MKAFLEYIPLVLFLIIYKLEPRTVEVAGVAFQLGGIFSATAVLIAGTVLVFGSVWLKQGQLSRTQWLVVGAVLVFGGITLLLRSESILKWKAPVVNWILGAVFLGSQWWSKTNMAQTMFGQLVEMPAARWKVLNLSWALLFIALGCANLFVAFTFHEYWVDFKVFGSMGILLVASVVQMFYIYPYLKESVELQEHSTGEPGPEDGK
ncbi:MAG: septation protein IspZ [Pseudomonadales bacterium]|jgi:intracellular septation protein|nr:septation protein IspZ [Pseudomonadales bacterium]